MCTIVIKPASIASLVLLAACSPPTPPTPALTEQNAIELLHYNNKAKDWLTYVKKHDPSCDYKIDIPDQSSHPTELDFDHIVWCGNRPGPREFDATVQFVYDKAGQHWMILRFAS